MWELSDLAAACEAILAVAGEPVSLERLAKALGEEVDPTRLQEALELVQRRHEGDGSGLQLEQVAGGYRLATKPQWEGVVREFLGVRERTRLSQAALETLAIVAYRQPVTLPEINFLRGVNSGGVLRNLVEKGLVRIAGRKQVVGTPLLYRTTKEFLVHFGLASLAELPSLEELGVAGEDPRPGRDGGLAEAPNGERRGA